MKTILNPIQRYNGNIIFDTKNSSFTRLNTSSLNKGSYLDFVITFNTTRSLFKIGNSIGNSENLYLKLTINAASFLQLILSKQSKQITEGKSTDKLKIHSTLFSLKTISSRLFCSSPTQN